MIKIPDKLKKDAIFQALFDVRFTCRDLPEVVVGKLAGNAHFKGWAVQRLAFADLPASLRQRDPALQHQPLMELRGNANQLVRIGDRSLSCHVLPPYPGWTAWQPELNAEIDLLYALFEDFTAVRFGLRYINALTLQHFVKDVSSLRLAVNVADAPFHGPLILNYQRERDSDHIAIVRVASREFVTNPLPSDLAAVVDIDVSTPAKFSSTDTNQAKAWLLIAHTQLKEEFFPLFSDETLEKLIKGE
jgi:uncharacterized protein (TIGR04255 family)